MRLSLILLPTLLLVSASHAQDPSAAANQAAINAMQQAQQAALNFQQQSMAIAAQNSQQTANDLALASQSTSPGLGYTAKPKFSVKAGTLNYPTTVKITDSTRGAIIYYTTDGWAPTTNSQRYLGPVHVDSTMTLQAIAIAPYRVPSVVAMANYSVKTAAPASQTAPPSTSVAGTPPSLPYVLTRGTPVPLVFAEDVSSKNAEVGDKVKLTLADDLKVGDTVFAKKGAEATASIIQVDKNGRAGAPGTLEFRVDFLDVDGKRFGLRGGEIKQGEAKPPNALVLVPYAGLLTLLKHGTDAEIKKGAAVTVYLDEDIPSPVTASN